MTDRELIETSPKPYILIGGPDASGWWNLNGCSHFALRVNNTHVWCTHGDWQAELKYDDTGKLTQMRITDYAYKVSIKTDSTKWVYAPQDHPDRIRKISGFKLVSEGIKHYSNGAYF